MMHIKLLLTLPLILVLTGCGGELKETPPSDATHALQQAWQDYYDAIAEVQTNFLASDSFKIDDAHRAGAYQLLQSLISSNVGGMMGGGNGDYPHIRPVLSPSNKLGVDNPDTFYRGATVTNPNGEYVYRVWGTLGNASDFLLEQFYGPDPQGAISVFEDDDLITDDEGNFEIFLSAQRRGDNWMELAATDKLITLLIRDSHTNWDEETHATVHIERLGTQGIAPPPLTESDLILPIQTATQILLRQGQFWPDFSSRMRLVGENKFIDFRATESLGIPTQFFSAGFFSLNEEQALLVTIPDVEAAYCGMQLTSFWAASPDWPNRVSSLSWCNDGSQAHPNADGSYSFVVSAKDPGLANWIDTSGFTQGVLYARIQSPIDPKADFGKPKTQVVAFNNISKFVDPTMPRLNAEGRKKQIAARQAHVQRRYQTW